MEKKEIILKRINPILSMFMPILNLMEKKS